VIAANRDRLGNQRSPCVVPVIEPEPVAQIPGLKGAVAARSSSAGQMVNRLDTLRDSGPELATETPPGPSRISKRSGGKYKRVQDQ
jgi:hypothetical protein